MEVSLPPNVPDESIPVELWSLEQLIPRIVQERGSFANITEDDLLREIEEAERGEVDGPSTTEQGPGEAAADDDDDVDMDNITENAIEDDSPSEATPISKEDTEEAQETELKNFFENRKEMTDQIRTALNESALALDFVSLLLSCQRPAAGTTSMSPLLKQRVAVGSLGADALWLAPEDENPQVGAGWKVQALDSASSLLQQASKRLKKEIQHEKTYWKSISDLANAGEALFKITKGDLRGLGVKYGFGDAGASYRYKGIALCNRDNDGRVSFKFDNPIGGKHLRVCLYDVLDGEKKLIGYSSPANIVATENPTLNELKKARAQIFEQELFFEMASEVRLLAPQKVSIVDGKIVILMMEEVMEISYVDTPVDSEEYDKLHPDAQLYPSCLKADFICSTLHLLLCHAHSVILSNRRALPAPLNTKVKSSPGPLFILRPLIAHLQHNKILRRSSRLLQIIISDYKDATMDLNKFSNIDEDTNKSSKLRLLLSPPQSTYTCTFPEKGIKITIITRSLLQTQMPLYEANAVSILESEEKSGSDTESSMASTVSKAGFYELNELEEWINWILNRV